MAIRITCRGTKLSDEVHTMVVEKSEKLKKYFQKVERIEVIFTAEKHRRTCEINVHAGPFDRSARVENGNELSAFEKALKAMMRQIKESKVKMIERRQKAINPAKMTNHSGKTPRVSFPVPPA